jgi:hypothetical protein
LFLGSPVFAQTTHPFGPAISTFLRGRAWSG